MATLKTDIGNNANTVLTIVVETTGTTNPEGRVIYRWIIRTKEPNLTPVPGWGECTWYSQSLMGPISNRKSDDHMLNVFLGFLAAALAGREYENRMGQSSERTDAFPTRMLDTLLNLGFDSDECAMLEEDPEVDYGYDDDGNCHPNQRSTWRDE